MEHMFIYIIKKLLNFKVLEHIHGYSHKNPRTAAGAWKIAWSAARTGIDGSHFWWP